MSEQADEQITLLREIRDNQKLQIERHAESLEIQKKQFSLYFEQYEKTVKLQDRAEAIQEKSGELVDKSRKLLAYLMPVIFLLLIYLAWILFN
ncbi:MAG: hypothetical protein ACKE9I_09725 [Methylophagaceae bacterium]